MRPRGGERTLGPEPGRVEYALPSPHELACDLGKIHASPEPVSSSVKCRGWADKSQVLNSLKFCSSLEHSSLFLGGKSHKNSLPFQNICKCFLGVHQETRTNVKREVGWRTC